MLILNSCLRGRCDVSLAQIAIVKGILGDSYLNYFRKKRMEKAAELLESTAMKVIDEANTVGYEN